MKKKYLIEIVMFLALIFSLSYVDGTLQVTAFSCNSQTGTVNVANLDSLTCQATVNNPDQSTATLNSAILYVDGNWLGSTSITGSGFDTSISAGASTTGTFTGMTPLSSGLKNFDYISLDLVTDTYVEDATINVIGIKTLSVNPSISAGDANEEFDLQVSVTAGGDIDAEISISLNDCNLKTGESSTVNLGSLNHNTQGSHVWKVIIGTGHCEYTVTATGTAGIASISSTDTDTITNNNPVTTTTTIGSGGSSGGGSGGDGGGGGSSVETEKTTDEKFDIEFFKEQAGEIIKKIIEGQSLSLSFDGETKHTITIDKVMGDSATITVSSNPVTLTLKIGETGYIDLNKDGIRDMSITLIDIFGKEVNIKIVKLEGAEILAEYEKIVQEKSSTSTTVGPDGYQSNNTYIYVFIALLLVLSLAIILFFKMKSEKSD